VLKGQGIAAPKETARQVHQGLDAHPGWAHNPKQEHIVRLQLYKILTPQTQRSAVGEEPGPMQAQVKRVPALKAIVPDKRMRPQRHRCLWQVLDWWLLRTLEHT
jgi:hypothetical protein